MFDLKAHLKALVESHAPSGHETAVRDVVREAWRDLTDTMEQDRLGSLIGIKRAARPLDPPRKIMLAAHMDEIGMMVRDIVDGFIYLHRVAGTDNRLLPAQPVMVHGRRPLPGIVATTPPHLLTNDKRNKYPTFDELVVDVGLPPDEVSALVRIGDLVTPDVPMTDLQNGKVMAKALDDRACVACVTVCLNHLQALQHRWEVYAAATAQEETGLYGAATAAYHIKPDIAIALDVGFAAQPGVDNNTALEMGGGPAIALGPNFHPKLVEKIKQTAKRYEIKTQEEVIPGRSGTDAWSIQVAREGVPTALFSIPIRNMHSPIETIDTKDIDRTGRLLAHFIAELDGDFLKTIAWETAKSAES